MKKLLNTFILFLLCLSSSWATEETGLEIVDTCLSEQKAMMGDPVSSVRYGLCLGYIKGVADQLNGTSLCLPNGAGTAKLTQALKLAFLDYAKHHQQQLKLTAKHTLVPALQIAFPCK